MIRTQVQLTEQEMQGLKRLAASSGRSIADLVRESVDRYLDSAKRPAREELVRRGLAVVGKFSSGLHDVSIHHDEYLAEALGDDLR